MLIYFYLKASATYCIIPFVFKGTNLGGYYSLMAISVLARTLNQSGIWNIPGRTAGGRQDRSPLFRDKMDREMVWLDEDQP